MDGKEEAIAGKRKTKNSTSLVEGERDLEKAKKESAKESKKARRLKQKEEEALQKVLAISELEAKRKEEVSHLL
jgi:hypothetical protein